jgi:signal transduction histidine kinase
LVLHARDVTERKQTEEALLRSLNSERQARAEAEAAARSREQFVSVAAHELKTPLTGLMLASDLLETELDGARDPQQIRETTKHVTVETRRLATLVSNLLGSMPGSVTSGDRGGESVDLAGLAARVARDARASSARHEVQLLAPATLVVPGDAVCLEQALRNLVDNAVKYSPHGGVVTIELSAAGQHARIVVADHGLGVPPEQREQIFDRYHQAHADDYVSGLGLGLAVTREIVEGHGGSLTAEFPDQGGSRFVIMLPLGAGS